MNLIKWFTTPQSSPDIDRNNFINVQIDAIGVGLSNAAAPFLPVFLARLGASSFEIGLLTTMPAVTGFCLAIFIGRFLQKQKKIIPWFSFARLACIFCYALTGLIVFFVPQEKLTLPILIIWAFATIPQTILNICFSVVMNSVAGPKGRVELMSRRWSILGLTTTIFVVIIGQILDHIIFPINYQVSFLILSIGGLISYYFSSHINIPDQVMIEHPQNVKNKNIFSGITTFLKPILNQTSFIQFNAKRVIFLIGLTMVVPLLPIYFVREIHAQDSWIAFINTAKTFLMILGYILWTHQSKRKGARFVILCTTLGLGLFPILTSSTSNFFLITAFAGMAGIFQAGIDLVFFDELMNTIPIEFSALFVSIAQSLTYMASIIAPLIGSLITENMGIRWALVAAGSIQIIGFLLFLSPFRRKKASIPSS